MIAIRETAQPRAIHPEAGSFPTGDSLSDVAALGGAKPHPRLVAMAEVFAECAANGPGADFRDLVDRDFTVAEISEYAPGARELAKSMIIRRIDTASALRADGINEAVAAARRGEFSRPPHEVMGRVIRSKPDRDRAQDLWSAYCFALSASRIDPWPGQRARTIERLQRYLVAAGLDDAADKIVDGLRAEQETMAR